MRHTKFHFVLKKNILKVFTIYGRGDHVDPMTWTIGTFSFCFLPRGSILNMVTVVVPLRGKKKRKFAFFR